MDRGKSTAPFMTTKEREMYSYLAISKIIFMAILSYAARMEFLYIIRHKSLAYLQTKDCYKNAYNKIYCKAVWLKKGDVMFIFWSKGMNNE